MLTISPDQSEDGTDTINRSVSVLDPGTGKVTAYDHGPAPIGEHSFVFFLGAKSDATQLRDFFSARRGMAVPFWVPSWRSDLILISNLSTSSTAMTVQSVGYTLFMFPNSLARRYLCVMQPSGTMLFLKVIGAVDNEDGTETLTLESAPGVAVVVGTPICFLHYARLSSDELDLQWESQTAGRCQLTYTELPLEVPA